MPTITQKIHKHKKFRLFPARHQHIRALDLIYGEIAAMIHMSATTFNYKMSGKIPWHEPETRRLLDEICSTEETLADIFPGRKVPANAKN